MTSRALVGLALLAGFVLAQTPDTLPPPPEPPDSTFRVDTVSRYRPAKSTGTAVLLSFLLPGGGQVYTGNWWKAAVIAPAEVTLGYYTVREHLAATDALHNGDSTAYVQHRDRRTVLLWWTGAVVAFSMADAYVSAQMYGFDREMHLTLGMMRAGIAMEF
ncbi:hypothetical protein JXD38_02875 [candidate division WOR-3 bacterium]|nr:hypothetical protein [candidate division WOR-3 bacterium]